MTVVVEHALQIIFDVAFSAGVAESSGIAVVADAKGFSAVLSTDTINAGVVGAGRTDYALHVFDMITGSADIAFGSGVAFITVTGRYAVLHDAFSVKTEIRCAFIGNAVKAVRRIARFADANHRAILIDALTVTAAILVGAGVAVIVRAASFETAITPKHKESD